MIMQNPALFSDDPGGHRRRVGVHRRRAAAALRGPPRPRGAGRHRRLDGRHPDRGALPEPGRRVPRPRLRALRPRRPGRARPRVPRPAPRLQPGDRARAAREGRPPGGPGRRLPAAGPLALPPVVRRGAHRARAAARVRLRAARAVPRRDQGRRARRHAGVLPDRGRPGAGAPGARGRGGDVGDHRRRRVRGLGRRPAAQGHHLVLRRRRGLHRLRAPRPPAHARDGAGPRRLRAVHAPPRADEPRDPGHLLRPAHGRQQHRGAARPPAGGLRRRAVRRGARGLAVDQGHARARTPPTSRPATTSAPARSWPSPPSTTSRRGRRAPPSSAPTCCWGSPRRPGSPSRGSTHERHGAGWVQRQRGGVRHQGVGRPRPEPGGDHRRPSGRGSGRVHPEQDDGRSRRDHQRPPHPHRRPGGRGGAQQRVCQRRHRRRGPGRRRGDVRRGRGAARVRAHRGARLLHGADRLRAADGRDHQRRGRARGRPHR